MREHGTWASPVDSAKANRNFFPPRPTAAFDTFLSEDQLAEVERLIYEAAHGDDPMASVQFIQTTVDAFMAAVPLSAIARKLIALKPSMLGIDGWSMSFNWTAEVPSISARHI